MSALSTRRLRDPNAGTGPRTTAQKPAKNLSPISITTKTSTQSLQKSSSGKENPRSGFRASGSAQKPVIRPVPRVEKAAVGLGGDGEARARWSTSAAPRGRSPSPSQFIRVFSDLRREKGSKVSADRSGKGVSKESKWTRNSIVSTNENGTSNFKENGDSSDNLVKSSTFSEGLGQESGKNLNLSADLANRSAYKGFKGKGSSGFASLDASANVNKGRDEKPVSVSKSDDKIEQVRKGVNLGLRRTSLDGDARVLEISKENGVNEDGVSSWVSNKYQSKLHEKLAFLEGKVKRIASDIKKTKEMLDMNNPDASKMILSDIQEKISGIEKAMGNVVSNSGSKLGVSTSSVSDNREVKIAGKSEVNQAESVKSSVNGLNSEDLEARLFPHHKLLRGRTSLKASSGGSQSLELPDVTEPSREVNVEEKPLSPVEENPIALEFLASLDKEPAKITVRRDQVHMAHCEVQEMDGNAISGKQDSSNKFNENADLDLLLKADERLDEFDDQENRQEIIIDEETDDPCVYQLNEMGFKTSTGGWFVSEGEAVLLAHDDGSCSFYDIANLEEKAVYNPPMGISPNIWRDCWIIRAPGADGCSGRYVVAASAGNTLDSGFCSWDFYAKDVRAFHIEEGGTVASRTVLGPLPNNTMHGRNTLTSTLMPETQQWWYKPCGPLIISTASSQRAVKVFDIRDGEKIMNWELQKPVLTMDYSSPLQWRNRGKVVIAEVETISVWDVSSLHAQALVSISSSGRKISALHVNNTDAELGGGVRLRATSSEAEGNDGVFCTPDSINILDFRHPSGIGAKIPKLGVNVHSVSSRGDSIFLGCTNVRSAGKKQLCSQVQQFSLRKQRLVSTYSLPESNAHLHHSAITQVWGNSNLVMAVCGLGLFVFDALSDDSLQSFTSECGGFQKVKEIIGTDDLYSPSFDYSGSRILLISRDRPAQWRHLL